MTDKATPLKVLVDGIHILPQIKGVGRYLLNTLREIVKTDSRIEFHVLILMRDRSQKLPQMGCIKWTEVPWHNHLWHCFWTVPNWARRLRPDIIWIPYETTFGMTSYPYLMICHDVPEKIRAAQKCGGESPRPFYARMVSRIDDLLIAKSLRRAQIVFSNSHYVRGWLEKEVKVPASRIRYAPCAPGADFSSLCREVDIEGVRRRLESPAGYILVFYTGDSRENFHVVPAIYQKVLEKGLSYRLVVAGVRDEVRSSIEALLSRYSWNNHVRVISFLESGREKELAELYTAASVYLDPSLHEGFGMQIIEAMACGTPVVCSNRGALPEVAGDAAVLANPRDIEEIALALSKVLTDRELRGRMIERGYKRSAAFSWEMTAKVIYQELIQVAS